MKTQAESKGTEISQLQTVVREKYGQAALRARSGESSASCCGSSGCCGTTTEAWDPITANLYDEGQTAGIPAKALLASLGCGNPTALAELHEGETVLDLGSGGGIDVLLSARRVGPTGRAYGLDMTDDMLALARRNAAEAGVRNVEFLRGRIEVLLSARRVGPPGKAYGLDMTDEMLELAEENRKKAGATNVTFLKGEIEHIPLPDASVDVIISNCVINLSGDKRQVLREAFRVLKPGGRFAVSDVVVRGHAPDAVRRNMELWVGCVAGALEEEDYRTMLADAGFEAIDIEVTRVYAAEDAAAFLEGSGLDAAQFSREIDGKFVSAFVRATKPSAPAQAGCCTGSDGLPCCVS